MPRLHHLRQALRPGWGSTVAQWNGTSREKTREAMAEPWPYTKDTPAILPAVLVLLFTLNAFSLAAAIGVDDQ